MAEGYINKDISFQLTIPIARCTISGWSGNCNLIGTNLLVGYGRFKLETAETSAQYIDGYNSVITNIKGVYPNKIFGQFSVEGESCKGQILCENNANAWFIVDGTSISLSPYIGKYINISYQIFYA